MQILETDRLLLRQASVDDAEFLRDVVNVPEFIKYVGDRGVHSLDDAIKYVQKITDHYEEYGFGIWIVEIKSTGEKAGLCGLLQRDHLDAPDIGFSFLPDYWAKGYAYESAVASIDYASSELGISKVFAIVSPENRSSIRLIEKLGLKYSGPVRMPDDDHDVSLYSNGQ